MIDHLKRSEMFRADHAITTKQKPAVFLPLMTIPASSKAEDAKLSHMRELLERSLMVSADG